MYERHFGLSKAPFRITPDPDFFFAGGHRGAVLEALVYAVTRGEGIIKVVGEVGSGKTMLCRMLERELPDNCEKIYLANPRLAPGEILHAIALELGLVMAAAASRLEVMHALHEYLLKRHAENVRVIMFVEEAQSMPIETLEEVRLLSNLETTTDKLLQIVLFGQPELDDKLNGHEIRQLRERITHSFELLPLAKREIRDYVLARARASGYRGPDLFTRGAIAEFAAHSQGLLRRINILADKALLAAFAQNAVRVERRHVRLAVRDSEFGRGAKMRLSLKMLAAVALALAMSLMAVLGREWFTSGFRVRDMTAQIDMIQPKLADADPGAANPLKALVASEPVVSSETLLPEVSPATGLVTIAHLRPQLDAPPASAEASSREHDQALESANSQDSLVPSLGPAKK